MNNVPDTDLLARVDTMEAGDEIDRLVAVHIFGYEAVAVVFGIAPDGTEKPVRLPRYSTDIADAWRVLEKFHSNRQDVTINGFDPYFCEIEDAEGRVIVMTEAPTAPLAICRAGLRAVLAPQ